MKRISLLLLLALAAAPVLAQTPKLSPLSRRYIQEARERVASSGHLSKESAGAGSWLGGLIKVSPAIDEAGLRSLGVRIGTKAGPIWTVRVPLSAVDAFTRFSGIDYIQLDEPSTPTLDSARRSTRVDSVHAGYGLPMPYNGRGVVVGVVDAGFDYGHPTLFDTSGTGYRVTRVWEQKNGAGPAPLGYTYGTELVDPVAMWAKGNDNGQTHGTHVAGIAAGSGFGSLDNSRYRGMAYGADLVLVGITPDKSQWMNTGASDMIDGISYVFRYAESVGKPAVVNLSWGSPLGPRDGSGLFSQALDNLTGPGRIFVCSAGNNGENKIHIQKTFTAADTLVRTYVTIPETPAGRRTWVDIWGDSTKSFCVKVDLHQGGEIASTGFLCLDDQTHAARLVGSNGDTCFVDIITSASEFNGKPRIFLDFDSRVADTISISVKGSDGTVNIWDSFVHNTTGYYGSFTSYGRAGAVNGNSTLSISDIASSRSAITVGAYASKTGWTSVAGTPYSYASYVSRGKLVPFSSRGPTADGRVKPDIAGPGFMIGSAVSSYDTAFASTGSEAMFVTWAFHPGGGPREYQYAVLSGTSMSSPAVSGIVALMLQIRPTLTPEEIKEILTRTAIRDNFTGTILEGGNSSWGNGKANAYGAVRAVLGTSAGTGGATAELTSGAGIYPNPGSGPATLTYTGREREQVKIDVLDLLGRPVYSDVWTVDAGYNGREIDLSAAGGGVYLVRLSSSRGVTPLRMVIR